MAALSLADLEAPSAGPSEDFGRTPPQDLAAEQSVLGGMLLSKDAIADVVEVLRGVDFYRPAHELVFEAVLDLYGRGEPADAVTVADELNKRGELGRVGGPAYLHTLLSSVPTAANAGFYAKIVHERAILRRLVAAGTKIVQLGYATEGGDVDELVNAAQAEIYQVTERRSSEDYSVLGDIMEGAIDEIEASSRHGDGLTGIPTGFADLDRLTNGLHPGQMIVIAARPAMGKALALDTPLATPGGWTTMGRVEVGDQVLGADGRPTTVIAATEILLGRPCYEVHFSDGSMIVADEQHLWSTRAHGARRVRTTAEIAATLRRGPTERELNHAVPDPAALHLPVRELPIGPYTLGAWLATRGIADAQITAADPEIVAGIEAEGLVAVGTAGGGRRYTLTLDQQDAAPSWLRAASRPNLPAPAAPLRRCGHGVGGRARLVSSAAPASVCPRCGGPSSGRTPCRTCRARHGTVCARLAAIGVLGDKHIPAQYLRAAEHQRRALLAGLLDADATVTDTGAVRLDLTGRRLAEDVRELLSTLGLHGEPMCADVHGRAAHGGLAYSVTFSTDEQVFALERKQALHKERRRRRPGRDESKYITEVTAVASVPVRCIQVDTRDHLYLAGPTMIPTHNSTVALDIARSAAIHHNMATVIFSLEMSKNEITMRLLSAEARIPLQNMRKGTMREEDWTRLARTMGDISEAPLFIDDSPNMALMEIRAKCRRLKQRHGLRLVVIDYLQLMSSGKRVESRQQEVSEFSRALKLLAKELEVPVIALSQLNRGPEQRTDKKPQMSDLRESGCLTPDTTVLRADTGATTTLGELFASGARDVPVWSLDDSLRYVRRHLTHVFPTGVKPVLRVTLACGRTVRATANHPFLTYDGWRPIGDLAPGTRVAVPRHVPAPDRVTCWSDEQVVRVARAIGDGAFIERHGTAAVEVTADPMTVPPAAFHLPKRKIALLLQHLWVCDGSVTVSPDGRGGLVQYVSSSRRLVDDVAGLLLRFGITGRTVSTRRPDGADRFAFDIYGEDDRRRFLTEVGVHGPRGAQVSSLLDIVRHRCSPPSFDAGAHAVWDSVREVLVEPAVTHHGPATTTTARTCAGTTVTHAPGRQRMARIADVLDGVQLDVEAVNDVLWDAVIAVDPDGEEMVYDATVLGNHNFVANGIAVHNSIEQDADMVILLHREDMYEKESPRAGEADFIVAKHRNGPTDTIVVAFQGHYSRFVDMAT